MLHKKKTKIVGGIYASGGGRPGQDFLCLASEMGPIERLRHKS